MNRSRRCLRVLAALGLAVATVLAHAAESERAKIAKERAAADARYAERERACRERFVVSSCIEDAKRERREAHDALRARQLKLDEETRRQRTTARRAELADKAADDAARERARAERAASAPTRSAVRPFESHRDGKAADGGVRAAGEAHDRPLDAGARLGLKPTRRASDEERRAREERSRAGYEARQQEAAAHRRDVEAKAAQRLQSRPAAAPLAVPGASSAR